MVAAAWIAKKAQEVIGDQPIVVAHLMEIPDVLKSVYRKLVVALHPDRRGSDVEFKRLQAAMAVLDK